MKKFDEEAFERLPISALKQHRYCQRRFALMYLESAWDSNYKIVEGDLLHKRVDDPFFNEKRGDVHISRSVPVFSENLNLYGIADIIEFIRDESGITISGKSGLWRINPLEYKNGTPEKSNADAFQLCAIAMCLEEMFQTEIRSGDIFYGKIKRRVKVEFTNDLKNEILEELSNLKILLLSQKIPQKDREQNCNLCSLYDLCLPSIFDKHKKIKEQVELIVKGEMG